MLRLCRRFKVPPKESEALRLQYDSRPKLHKKLSFTKWSEEVHGEKFSIETDGVDWELADNKDDAILVGGVDENGGPGPVQVHTLTNHCKNPRALLARFSHILRDMREDLATRLAKELVDNGPDSKELEKVKTLHADHPLSVLILQLAGKQ